MPSLARATGVGRRRYLQGSTTRRRPLRAGTTPAAALAADLGGRRPPPRVPFGRMRRGALPTLAGPGCLPAARWHRCPPDGPAGRERVHPECLLRVMTPAGQPP